MSQELINRLTNEGKSWENGMPSSRLSISRRIEKEHAKTSCMSKDVISPDAPEVTVKKEEENLTPAGSYPSDKRPQRINDIKCRGSF